jgi:hypothetical protein
LNDAYWGVQNDAARALRDTPNPAAAPLLAAKDRHFIVAFGGLGGLRYTDSEAALVALRVLTREGKLLRRAFAWLLYTKLKRTLRRRESAAR